jgi:ATP-binding cassette ChvD family protein
LDAESIDWLEQHLRRYKGTVIAVTHDRYFLDNVAGWILELDRGEGIPYQGNYSGWLEQKSKRLAQEEKSESKRQKSLQRELDWVRMAPKARHAKSKARLTAYHKLLDEDIKEKEARLELFIPSGPRLGNTVIEVEGVCKSFGDRVLVKDLTFSLPPAGVVGIIGPNGVGKTTLFRMIVGQEKPDSGTIRIGETVQLAYVDQSHDDLIPDKTVIDLISGGTEYVMVDGRQVNARAYLSKFNFTGSDQNKKLKDLSGGERNRAHLALTLKQGANVLLLDEPTNDIDVNTLRALEEAIENFPGCAVIISHDRWFLDRVCTHMLAYEGDGTFYWFEGNFADYEENLRHRKGESALRRNKYRDLSGRTS